MNANKHVLIDVIDEINKIKNRDIVIKKILVYISYEDVLTKKDKPEFYLLKKGF